MDRRQFLALGLGTATAAGVAGLTAIGDGAPDTPMAPMAMGMPAATGPDRDMIRQLRGRWLSHLLPFAAPFTTQAELVAALQQARQDKLFR